MPVSPEDPGNRLLGDAFRPCDCAIAAEALGFIESGHIPRAAQGGSRRSSERIGSIEDEGFDLRPPRAERQRMPADWILAPLTGQVAGYELDADAGLDVV